MTRCYPERGVEGGNRPHHPDLGPPKTYDPSSVLTMCTGNFGEGARDSGTIRELSWVWGGGRGSQNGSAFLRAQRREQTCVLEVVELRVDRVEHEDHGAGVRMSVRQAVCSHGPSKALTRLFAKQERKKI